MSACLDKTFKVPEDIARQWGFPNVRQAKEKQPQESKSTESQKTAGREGSSFKKDDVSVTFQVLVQGRKHG